MLDGGEKVTDFFKLLKSFLFVHVLICRHMTFELVDRQVSLNYKHSVSRMSETKNDTIFSLVKI